MPITALEPTKWPWFQYDGYSFSLGLTDSDKVWLSGHSASSYDTDTGHIVVRGGMADQAAVAHEKASVLLDAAGLSWQDVTHVVDNVTAAGLNTYHELVDYRRRMGLGGLAVTTVVVDHLLRPDALIEIEVDASAGTEANGISPNDVGVDETPVRLPMVYPIDSTGEVIAPGDFAAQYRACLERAAALLQPLGLGLSDVVRTVDYSTPSTRRAYPTAGSARRELLGPVYPASAGILVERLAVPDALIALDVTATRQPSEAVNGGWARYETLTYSASVRSGRDLYMSGFAALDLETQDALHSGDVAAQAEVIYESIAHLLSFAGGSVADLVRTTEYVTPGGLDAYREVSAVRRKVLRAPWPASTGAVAAALLRREFLLEVIPTARLGAPLP